MDHAQAIATLPRRCHRKGYDSLHMGFVIGKAVVGAQPAISLLGAPGALVDPADIFTYHQ